MNILVQFEDSHGCYTLFRESPSILNKVSTLYNVDFRFGLTSGKVLKVPFSLRSKYDIIILIFDLDAMSRNDYALTRHYFLKAFNKNNLDLNSKKGKEVLDKIIFIPIYFCYETLYLYSDKIRHILMNLDTYDKSRGAKILNVIESSLSYSSTCPENMYNIVNKLEGLQLKIENITGNKSDSWTPQHIHLKLSVELLKLLYSDIAKSQRTDDLFIKSEDKLFESIKNTYGNDVLAELINSIISGLNEISVYNRTFYKLITLNNINELNAMKNTKNKIESLCKRLDSYNSSIQGIKRDICDLVDELSVEAYKLNQKL